MLEQGRAPINALDGENAGESVYCEVEGSLASFPSLWGENDEGEWSEFGGGEIRRAGDWTGEHAHRGGWGDLKEKTEMREREATRQQ